jgi:hypothetical protein
MVTTTAELIDSGEKRDALGRKRTPLARRRELVREYRGSGERCAANRPCTKSTLSSYAAPIHVRPPAPPHHKCDRSAAIGPQITAPARPKAQNLYGDNLAVLKMGIKSVTQDRAELKKRIRGEGLIAFSIRLLSNLVWR